MARFIRIYHYRMSIFCTIYLAILINSMESKAEDVKNNALAKTNKPCNANANITCSNKTNVTDKNYDNTLLAVTSSNTADFKATAFKTTGDIEITSDNKDGKKLMVHPSVIGVTVIALLYIVFLILYYFFYTRKKQKNSAKEESSHPLKDKYNDSALFESSVLEKNSNSSYIWPVCEEDGKYMLPKPSTSVSLSNNNSAATINPNSSYPFIYILNDYEDNIPSDKDSKSSQNRYNGHCYAFNQDNKTLTENAGNEPVVFNISEADDSDIKEDSMLLLPACNITRKNSYRRACRGDYSYSTDGVSSNDNDDVFLNDEPCDYSTNNLTVSKTNSLSEQNSRSNSNGLLQPVSALGRKPSYQKACDDDPESASVTSLLHVNDNDDLRNSGCGITLVIEPDDTIEEDNLNHV